MSDSAHSRQHRLALLARRNRGRTEFKTYAEDLARLLTVESLISDTLDLEATDHQLAANKKGLQESTHSPQLRFQKTWAYEPTKIWSRECARAGALFRGRAGVLFVGPYEYCGAVRVDPERALQAVSLLLDFDGDTLNLGATDGSSGLYLDKFEEHSDWFVELVFWGEWAQVIAPVIAV